MTYDCMSDDELTLWREGAAMVARQTGYETQKPCADCPLAFRLEEYRAGRCCQPRPGTYSEDQRAYKRAWMRRYRARSAGVQ